jgi:thiol:disulfide interchange protein DsbD
MTNRLSLFLTLFLLLGLTTTAHAFEDELLPPDEAFALSAAMVDAETVRLTWDIADGYYLYKSKFRFRSDSDSVAIGPAEIPDGTLQNDEFFGEIEVFRHQVVIDLPIDRVDTTSDTLLLTARSQGCADIGVCYPPHEQQRSLTLPDPSGKAVATALPTLPSITDLGTLFGMGGMEDELLPPDEAFRFDANVNADGSINIWWQVAPDYYLYRDKIKLEIVDHSGVTLDTLNLPEGELKNDEYFGNIAVFHNLVESRVAVTSRPDAATSVQLKASFQGCAERGVCYPPMSKTVALELPAVADLNTTTAAPKVNERPPSIATDNLSEQDQITQVLRSGNWLTILPLMFLAGLGLAFTACVYPMIPILSSLIVGHGETITRGKALFLSFIYVEAVALTYAAIGVASGVFGAGIQGLFQNTWVLAGFAVVFVALALSMFGFYNLQLPSALQSKLTEISRHQKSGNLIGVAIMGVLSALIIGPCAGPVLIGILAFIGQEGDYILGGVSLFVLGNGLGAPLLLVGATGGQVLPRAGLWMNAVKAVFGVILLGVAVLLLERILPGPVTLVLWALLLIVPAIYLKALDPLAADHSGWKRLWKGIGVAMLIYGIILMIGAATGGRDVFRPLANLSATAASTNGGYNNRHLAFTRIKSVDDFEQAVAGANGKMVMLDFYADWCTYCIKLEDYTFSEPEVHAALSNVVLLQADVTASDDIDLALLNHFSGVYAPPAILFFGTNGKEIRSHRVTGFMTAEMFEQHVRDASTAHAG